MAAGDVTFSMASEDGTTCIAACCCPQSATLTFDGLSICPCRIISDTQSQQAQNIVGINGSFDAERVAGENYLRVEVGTFEIQGYSGTTCETPSGDPLTVYCAAFLVCLDDGTKLLVIVANTDHYPENPDDSNVAAGFSASAEEGVPADNTLLCDSGFFYVADGTGMWEIPTPP